MNGSIDGYLAEFSAALRTIPRDHRRAMAEVAAHLDDAADALVATGLERPEAARVAIERFGSADLIATTFNARASFRTAFLDVYLRLGGLVGLAVFAFGVSNLLSAPLAWVFGATFVAGVPEHLRVPLDGCPALARAYPHAADCAAAWSQQSIHGSIIGGTMLTVVGGAAIALHWFGRRRLVGRAAKRRPQRVFQTLTIGGFALIGVALSAVGLIQTLTASPGDHRWLPLALMCAAVVTAQVAANRRVAMGGDPCP